MNCNWIEIRKIVDKPHTIDIDTIEIVEEYELKHGCTWSYTDIENKVKKLRKNNSDIHTEYKVFKCRSVEYVRSDLLRM